MSSSWPLVSPNATRTEVVDKIIYRRQHDHFGPAKIAMYLKRYHDIHISPRACGGSSSGWPEPAAASQRHQRRSHRIDAEEFYRLLEGW